MNQTTPPGADQQTPSTNSGDAGVFAVIADLETRLGALKQMHEQGSRRQGELDGREAELALRDNELQQRIAELASRQSQIDAMTSGLADRQRALEQSVESLNAKRSELDALARQAEQARVDAERRCTAAAMAEQQVAEHSRVLEERRNAMERLATEAQAARQETQTRAQEISERESALTEKLEAAQRLHEQTVQEREAANADLAALETALAEREAAVGQAAAKLDQQRTEIALGQERLSNAQQRLADESARCRREMEEREQDARDREAALRELEERLNERMAELKIEAEQVARQRAMVTEQARTLAEQAGASDEHASAIHSGRAEQAQIQLGEANARVAGLQTELDHVRADLSTALDDLTQAQAAAGQATQGAHPEEVERRDRTIQQLRDELDQLRSATTSLQSRLDESENAAASMHGVDEQEIAKREQAIVRLKERLDEARAEVETLRERADQAERKAREARNASGTADPAAAGQSAARRERLRRYKSLLQGQARKIIQAQSALQKRHGECEQILSQRQKLQMALEQVGKLEKSSAAGRARSGAMVFVACATVTLGVLAALSWTLAEQIWPGTYAAQATIKADAHGRKATPGELSSWQAYHEDLVKNPQLMEVAAERLGRRGIAKLGTPAELRAKLEKDMFVQSAEAGSLTIELREVGHDRAKLVLDTYVTAIKSVADTARAGRAEDLGTTITAPSTVLAAPVIDERLERAGMLLAGGSLAALLGGMLIWSRMAASKRKFEQSQAIEEAIDQVDWGKLEASMAKAQSSQGNVPAGKGRKPTRD